MLELRLLSPDPSSDGNEIVVAKPGAITEFTYQLTNVGCLPLKKIRVVLFCQCAIKSPPPDELAVGATGQISFSFRAPDVGIRSENVYFWSDDGVEPVGACKPTIKVLARAPRIMNAPDVVRLTAVDGQDVSQQILIETVEETGSERFIRGLEVTPHGVLDWQLEGVREADADADAHVRRSYVFQLSVPPNTAPNGRVIGQLVIKSEESDARRETAIDFEIQGVRRLLVVPPEIDFHATDAPDANHHVTAICRSFREIPTVIDAEYDDDLLEVRPLDSDSSKFPSFSIRRRVFDHELARETTVVFCAGDARTEVAVRLHGALGQPNSAKKVESQSISTVSENNAAE